MQLTPESTPTLPHTASGSSTLVGEPRPSTDELRRTFVEELLVRSQQLEQLLRVEQDPDERLRLVLAQRDVRGELKYMRKLMRDQQNPPPDGERTTLQKVTKALAARNSSLKTWCIVHRTSRTRVSMALRGEPGAGETHRSMAGLLLVELGLSLPTCWRAKAR